MSKFNTWQHGTQEDLIETVIMSVSSQFQEWIDSNTHFSENDIVRIAQNRASWRPVTSYGRQLFGGSMMMMMTMHGNH